VFINKITNNTFKFSAQVVALSAFLETLIRVINNGSTSGKLKTAIRVKLLSVREAMAETIVKMEAKPKLPKINAVKKMP